MPWISRTETSTNLKENWMRASLGMRVNSMLISWVCLHVLLNRLKSVELCSSSLFNLVFSPPRRFRSLLEKKYGRGNILPFMTWRNIAILKLLLRFLVLSEKKDRTTTTNH